VSRSESGSRGSHGSHGSQSGSQSSSSPGQSLHGSRISGVPAIRKYRPVHQAVVGVVKHQPRAVASVAHFSLDSFLPLVVVFPEALLMANVSCWVTGVRAQVIADQVMATGFLMACAYLHPTVIRETMAPRQRVVSCPNESGCRYT
jgi:hypothetical protein